MNTSKLRAAASLCILAGLLLACGTPPPAVEPTVSEAPAAAAELPETQAAALPTPESVPSAASPVPATASPASAFTIAVIVDTLSDSFAREQAESVIRESSSFLQPLTGIALLATDFVEDSGGGSTADMASRYIGAHANSLPNGLVIFSRGDEGRASRQGGYGFAIAGPPEFRNVFASQLTGAGQLYVAVVDFSYRYAACGYGGSDSVQSPTSLDGECRNQAGMACVQHNAYSMCADSVAHLYASTPTHFVSSTNIHELLHLFSPGGDQDHYNTPECNGRMGYPAEFFDLQEAQYHNGLCPYVYDDFVSAYKP